MSDRLPRLPSFYRLVAHDRIDSTSEEAKRLAASGAVEGTLVWAREQTAGRGRRGRVWSSPPGNLYVSLVLRPACAPGAAAQLGFAAAVGLGAALESLLPAGAGMLQFKWPNDLLVERRKIAGILLDASTGADGRLDWLILGIGVNIESFPDQTSYGATSLRDVGAGAVTVEQVLEVLGVHLLRTLDQWRREGFAPIRRQWLSHALGLGERIDVRLEQDTLSGRFVELSDSGALTLELPQGERRIIAAGDVFYPAL